MKNSLPLQAMFALFLCLVSCGPAYSQRPGFEPGSRTVVDAHNCYPYFEWWQDRIDRALSSGTPLAIEQDLYWYTDPQNKATPGRSLLAHGAPVDGHEPTMEQYFFERIRPIVEDALRRGNRGDWPLITLNLDFKTEEPQHLAAVWKLLEKYQTWLTTAVKGTDSGAVERLDIKPVLVLTGESNLQAHTFYDDLRAGERLLVFGAVHTHTTDPMAAPEVLESEHASNYRRWWNNSWSVVERGGQTQAADWAREDEVRLRALVEHAHANGLLIRLYTLDGATNDELSCHGWFRSYNFGSLSAVQQRWRAAQKAGVDFIASDQYEALANFLKNQSEAQNRSESTKQRERSAAPVHRFH
jgi:hypothetical protein